MQDKIENVISKFEDGEERFKKSALFNQVVQSLARGGDEYYIIDMLIKTAESAQISFEDHLKVCTHRQVEIND